MLEDKIWYKWNNVVFSALIRERDELAAALEVKDRIKGESDTPGEEGPFSSEEIIVEVKQKRILENILKDTFWASRI